MFVTAIVPLPLGIIIYYADLLLFLNYQLFLKMNNDYHSGRKTMTWMT